MANQLLHFIQRSSQIAKNLNFIKKISPISTKCAKPLHSVHGCSCASARAFSSGARFTNLNSNGISNNPEKNLSVSEPSNLEISIQGDLPIDVIQKVSSESNDNDSSPSKTHFGFQSVPEELKETLVGKVFSSVASSYDVMNDCMSFGVHRLWKDHFIHAMAPGPGTKLLDVAGGTGDIALRFLEYCQKMHNDNSAHVRVVDINPSMLAHGSERYHKSQFKQNNQALFQVGNAECLESIEDNSVDVYTISFGIRNCTHIDRVLKEAYRVLKPGGRFMCLEFSKLGAMVANDRDSYQYLVESIRQFPDQRRFSQMIKEAGFATVGDGFENLTFGVAAMHTGYKF